jgi:hypothetical protein
LALAEVSGTGWITKWQQAGTDERQRVSFAATSSVEVASTIIQAPPASPRSQIPYVKRQKYDAADAEIKLGLNTR